MIDKQRNIGTWITIALLLFGMISGAIAFTVTTNNKANVNEQVNCNQDVKIHRLEQIEPDVKTLMKSIDELREDYKKSNENQTKILVAIGRLETKIEGLENR